MTKILCLLLTILAFSLIAVFSTKETIEVKTRCLDFIEGINPTQGKRIYNALVKYRRGLPLTWITALVWGESRFNPQAINGLDKGLGQLNPSALGDIEKVYGIKIDELRLFEIEYNIYLTGLFAERCKSAASPYAVGKYNILYATIMTYKDWLTWTDWTQTKALRSWERYQGLKYNYMTHNYESERV